MSIHSVKTHCKSTYNINRMAIKGCRFTVYVDLQCDYPGGFTVHRKNRGKNGGTVMGGRHWRVLQVL